MSVGRYVEGVVLLAVCTGVLGVGARRLRWRLAPGYDGLMAGIANGIVFLGLLIVTLEAVGVIGVLDRVGVVSGCVVVGVAAALLGARSAPAGRATATPVAADAQRRLVLGVAVAAVAVFTAAWVGWTVYAYRHGMETVDTLWYHLPFAARFVQLHNIRHLQYFDNNAITAFYPANSELIHAFGMVLFGSDVLSPLIDLGWGAAALASAWAIGRPWGREPHCLLACIPMLVTPGLVDTQPGGAYDDIVCLALLLAALALVVNGMNTQQATPGRRLTAGASAVAAVAAGVALGTKFTMIVPAIVLGLGAVAVLARGARLRHAGIWAAGLIVCGGYWYLRDGIAVHNPLPSLSHLGPLSLPSPKTTTVYTVWQYVFEGHIWKDIFIPGLRQSFGLAWWALILGSIAGMVVATVRWRRDPRLGLLGGLALVSGVAFLFTPQTLGIPGAPIFFVDNVRYVDVALALGLILLALAPGLERRATGTAWLLAMSLAVFFTVLDPGVWRSGFPVAPFASAIHGGPALVGAAVGAVLLIAGEVWLWRHRLGGRWTSSKPKGISTVVGRAYGSGLLAAGVVAIAGWFVADAYQHDRYRNTGPMPRIYAWAQHVHGARIGLFGAFDQYPLVGQDVSNRVQYIGVPTPHRGFTVASSCAQWRGAIDAAHYDYVVVSPIGFAGVHGVPALSWTQTSANAHPILRQFLGTVEYAVLFRITGRLDPQTCPRA